MTLSSAAGGAFRVEGQSHSTRDRRAGRGMQGVTGEILPLALALPTPG
jgi:hypothetical protein